VVLPDQRRLCIDATFSAGGDDRTGMTRAPTRNRKFATQAWLCLRAKGMSRYREKLPDAGETQDTALMFGVGIGATPRSITAFETLIPEGLSRPRGAGVAVRRYSCIQVIQNRS